MVKGACEASERVREREREEDEDEDHRIRKRNASRAKLNEGTTVFTTKQLHIAQIHILLLQLIISSYLWMMLGCCCCLCIRSLPLCKTSRRMAQWREGEKGPFLVLVSERTFHLLSLTSEKEEEKRKTKLASFHMKRIRISNFMHDDELPLLEFKSNHQ